MNTRWLAVAVGLTAFAWPTSAQDSEIQKMESEAKENAKRPWIADSTMMVAEKACIQDVRSASLKEGLAQRKAMADLLAYGCIKMVDFSYVACVGNAGDFAVIDIHSRALVGVLVRLQDVMKGSEPGRLRSAFSASPRI